MGAGRSRVTAEFVAPLAQERLVMNDCIRRIFSDTEGQDLIEYALLAALIALAAVTAMQTLTGAINTKFENVSSALNSAS
jgi:pilus assembly protein Flp/PilA